MNESLGSPCLLARDVSDAKKLKIYEIGLAERSICSGKQSQNLKWRSDKFCLRQSVIDLFDFRYSRPFDCHIQAEEREEQKSLDVAVTSSQNVSFCSSLTGQ